MEPSGTSTTVTGPVGESLQADTEDAPVLKRPAPLTRLHDSRARLSFLLTLVIMRINASLTFSTATMSRQVFSYSYCTYTQQSLYPFTA